MVLDSAAAIIAPEKLRDYILSTAHPIGRYKSAFFRSLGYTQVHWQQLEPYPLVLIPKSHET